MRRSTVRWLVAIAILAPTAGCGGTGGDLSAGEPCVRSTQCAPGLVCAMGACTGDLSGFGNGTVPSADAGVQLDAGEPIDAGEGVDSGSPMEVDAGPDVPDAGPPDTDAGPPEPDAGPPESDAGPPESDAGPPETDAGALDTDAGAAETDAGA